MAYKITFFYKFVPLEDFEEIRKPLLETCHSLNIVGTILLAREGINGTIGGTTQDIDGIVAHLRSDERLNDLQFKFSEASEKPFHRIKVRLKKEIITMGVPGVDPFRQTGQHVSPEEWNHLINDPDVYVLDTRNKYETAIGSFENAVDPQTESFGEITTFVEQNLAKDKDRKIAMFCTGGIRCEKLSAYMLGQGFRKIYQLNGGILKYLEEMPEEQSHWKGDCFVFDHRVSVGHALTEGEYTMCHGCGNPLAEEDRRDSAYEESVSCLHCADSLTDVKRNSLRERQKQIQLAKKRQAEHLGQKIHKF